MTHAEGAPGDDRDVAAASGVGVGTVSRVINGAANVREATRAQVLRAIEQLGYRPSHLAASLSRGTPRTVAIVVPHLTRPSSVERLAGALAVLAKYEYDTVVCNVDTPAQRDHVLAMLVARHRTDGVIVVSLPLSRAQLAAFRAAALPLVTVDVAARGVPHTVIDDVAGGRLATEPPARARATAGSASSATGCSARCRPRWASPPPSGGWPATGRRWPRPGSTADDSLVRLGPHGPASAQALAAELLGLADPPSAIFAASDTQAMGVLAAADQLGAQVPGQLSVIGFDDIQSAALLGLSTVRQPLEDSGAQGAERLCALLRGEPVRPLRQVLEVQVVPRATTGRPGPRRASRPPSAATERGPRGRPQTLRTVADSSGPGRRAAYRITRAL